MLFPTNEIESDLSTMHLLLQKDEKTLAFIRKNLNFLKQRLFLIS